MNLSSKQPPYGLKLWYDLQTIEQITPKNELYQLFFNNEWTTNIR